MGESSVFLAHLDHLSRVAPVDRPVLIIGERSAFVRPITILVWSIFCGFAVYRKFGKSAEKKSPDSAYARVYMFARIAFVIIAAGAFTHTPVPKITGTVMVGKTLTAKPGTWAPGKPKFSYRWSANGKALKTGTKYKLTVSTSLVGKSLSVRVTGKLTGFVSVTESSVGTKAVVAKKAPAKKKAKKKNMPQPEPEPDPQP